MFFKMLKNDLKMKKGLNLILFIFIVIASVLVYVSASQLYIQLTGEERTVKSCSSSDLIMMFENTEEKREEKLEIISQSLTEHEFFSDFYQSEGVTAEAKQFDFERIDEDDKESFFEKIQLITTLPRECNLVYDTNDKPFYVKNGTVWISHKMRDVTGSKTGDHLKIITPMGRVYDFEIAGFYKEPTAIYLFKYFLSDDDYKVISADFPVKTDIFSVYTPEVNNDITSVFFSDLRNNHGIQIIDGWWSRSTMSDDYVVIFIITFSMILMSIFMLVIILMTIRFTMISALRDEEKDIGMMRAMGIDSLRFRWLFVAKYIAFAVTGGVIGIIAGIPVSYRLMHLFAGGITWPPLHELVLVGAASALLMTSSVILFCLFVMRRINKISVIDAIHGENRGERFGKTSALLLHRRKKMPVPVYLGLSDILTRIKRYIFLVIAYTLGGMMILLPGYLYHSVINPEFMKYSMIYSYDFFPDFSDEMMKEYEKRENAENKFFWDIYNDDLKNNGINAHVDTYCYSSGELYTGGRCDCDVYFNFDDMSPIIYSEGTAPVLENEIAMSSYTARNRGIKPGDEIEVGLNEYSGDKLHITLNKKKVIVTGLIDMMEWASPYLIMGSEYDKSCINGKGYYALNIYSDDKQTEWNKMNDLFGGHVMTGEEAIMRYLEDYEIPLRLFRNMVFAAVMFVNILLTALYMNIFISEDKSEIALQRCLGTDDRKIRAAELFRMMTLTAASVIAAIIISNSVGARMFDSLFGAINLSGFRFIPMPVLTFVIMPAVSLLTVLIPSLVRLGRIDKIDIRSIAEE
ncbi:MAG: hypothetical protein IKN85_12465 [Oscillospiraceae bacterium]|nr:hypothetical protein [Oscillospiraceae bacterium]